MKIMLLVPPGKEKTNVVRDLVYGCWCKGKRIGGTKLPPLSLFQIAAILKRDSFNVKLIDIDAFKMTIDDLGRQISDYDVVILLTSVLYIQEDLKILQRLKKINSNLKTIVFGNYPTVSPELTVSQQGIDFAVRHEPEYIIRDLVRSLDRKNRDWKNIKGISFLNGNKYIHNPNYPRIKNLDELPIPDRNMIPKTVNYFNPVVKDMPYTTMTTSRGCFGQCTFCSSPSFYGNRIRYRSVGSVMEELRAIKVLGYKEVFFRDEVFTFSRERARGICAQISKEKLNMKWICSTRSDFLDYETMSFMKEAGCHMIRIGVESGVQSLLDNVKKGITLEQIRKTFKWAHKLRLDTHAHLMIGLPGESQSTIKATVKFVKEINPTIATFGVLIPYQGTPLFEYLVNKHPEAQTKLKEGNSNQILSRYLTNISVSDLFLCTRKCYMSFYLRFKYVLKWFKRIHSLSEFKRVLRAGFSVIEFIFGRE